MTYTPPGSGAPGPLRDLPGLGVVALPSVTREELSALGAQAACPLRDVAEEQWWEGLAEPQRDEVAAAGRRSLVERGLAAEARADGHPDAAAGVEVAPELAAVLSVRSNPAIIAVLGQPGRDAAQAPRVFGALDDLGRLDWLLVERVADGRHEASAVTPAYAVDAVTGWLAGPHRPAVSRIEAALGPAARQVDADGPLVRTLEVMRPVPSEPGPARTRLVVLSTPAALAFCPVGVDGAAGAPQELDRDALRVLVAEAFDDLAG